MRKCSVISKFMPLPIFYIFGGNALYPEKCDENADFSYTLHILLLTNLLKPNAQCTCVSLSSDEDLLVRRGTVICYID